jgi:hypothetical protein
MSEVIRLDALEALHARIETSIPDLAQYRTPGGAMRSRISVSQTPPDRKAPLPSMAIVPSRFRLETNQESIHSEPDPDTAVINCGRWRTSVQLRLVATNAPERERLEELVTALFFAREDAPGVLLTRVADAERGDWTASWTIDDGEWNDEAVMGSALWSVLTVDATIPLLVRRAGIFTIDQLLVGITSNFTAAVAADPFTSRPGLAVYQVASDGSISRA